MVGKACGDGICIVYVYSLAVLLTSISLEFYFVSSHFTFYRLSMMSSAITRQILSFFTQNYYEIRVGLKTSMF